MYKLYIDSSQKLEKSIELRKIENGIETTLDLITGNIDLVSSIETLLRKYNLKTTDIHEVIPKLGPGSFTGLKLGITVSNVLNYLNGKKDIADLYLPNYGSEPDIAAKEF